MRYLGFAFLIANSALLGWRVDRGEWLWAVLAAVCIVISALGLWWSWEVHEYRARRRA